MNRKKRPGRSYDLRRLPVIGRHSLRTGHAWHLKVSSGRPPCIFRTGRRRHTRRMRAAEILSSVRIQTRFPESAAPARNDAAEDKWSLTTAPRCRPRSYSTLRRHQPSDRSPPRQPCSRLSLALFRLHKASLMREKLFLVDAARLVINAETA